MLGYQYSLEGTVVHGDQIGRSIGFPTANLEITEPHKLLPKHGAYVVKVIFDHKEYNGMLNLGYRPTVSGESLRLEVHIFDFNQDIYGVQIRVILLDRLRDETKFKSVDELKSQLFSDKEQALKYSI
jgi:riboflavin kinase/FMN adenylyltransferase